MISPIFALTNVREFDVSLRQQDLHRFVFPFGERDLPQVQNLQGFADIVDGVGEYVQRVAPRVDGG